MKVIDPGNSIFKDLITNNNFYVDKTKDMYNLVTDGIKFHFLSRPRRFGKSLTLSTLEEIFKGRKDLFKGLYIESTDYDWKEYPVIHLDFSKITYTNTENLREQIKYELMNVAESYNVEINPSLEYNQVLDSLITRMSKREKVVILIDEYDSPLTSNINNNKIEEIRNVLRGFYSVIKASGSYIRFSLITGVTKFSKMSIFSAMNNLVDISMNDKYATMYGYTQEEMEDNFTPYIEEGIKNTGYSREEYLALIKKWYDGYLFSPNGETVYNPVSIGFFFREGGKDFNNYWINTGGMAYLLVETARRVKFDISIDTEITVSDDILKALDIIEMAKTDVSKRNFLSLLYQSGYLTIKKAQKIDNKYLYTLGYPNKEVEEGLTGIILHLYLGSAAVEYEGLSLLGLFYNGRVDEAVISLKVTFASIPYHELIFNQENVWHAAFMCMMRTMGADIIGEVSTNIGRIDCVVTCPEVIYIIEFKFNQSAENAIEQIREKKYYLPYLDRRKAIELIGINFSTEEKNIVEWKKVAL